MKDYLKKLYNELADRKYFFKSIRYEEVEFDKYVNKEYYIYFKERKLALKHFNSFRTFSGGEKYELYQIRKIYKKELKKFIKRIEEWGDGAFFALSGEYDYEYVYRNHFLNDSKKVASIEAFTIIDQDELTGEINNIEIEIVRDPPFRKRKKPRKNNQEV